MTDTYAKNKTAKHRTRFIPSFDVLNPETGMPIVYAGLSYDLGEFLYLSRTWGFDNVTGTLWCEEITQ